MQVSAVRPTEPVAVRVTTPAATGVGQSATSTQHDPLTTQDRDRITEVTGRHIPVDLHPLPAWMAAIALQGARHLLPSGAAASAYAESDPYAPPIIDTEA